MKEMLLNDLERLYWRLDKRLSYEKISTKYKQELLDEKCTIEGTIKYIIQMDENPFLPFAGSEKEAAKQKANKQVLFALWLLYGSSFDKRIKVDSLLREIFGWDHYFKEICPAFTRFAKAMKALEPFMLQESEEYYQNEKTI
jgi:hypothetical protein